MRIFFVLLLLLTQVYCSSTETKEDYFPSMFFDQTPKVVPSIALGLGPRVMKDGAFGHFETRLGAKVMLDELEEDLAMLPTIGFFTDLDRDLGKSYFSSGVQLLFSKDLKFGIRGEFVTGAIYDDDTHGFRLGITGRNILFGLELSYQYLNYNEVQCTFSADIGVLTFLFLTKKPIF